MPGVDTDEMATRVGRIVTEIGEKHLHGTGSAIQGAVLADLVAMWLAGHMPIPLDNADRKDVEAFRDLILENFIDTVRVLVPVNEAIILERHGIKVKP